MAIKRYIHFYYCELHDDGFAELSDEVVAVNYNRTDDLCCGKYDYYGAIKVSDGTPGLYGSPRFSRITAMNMGGWRSRFFLNNIYDESGNRLDVQMPPHIVNIVDR